MNKRANLVGAVAFVLGLAGFQSYAVKVKNAAQGGELTRVLVVTKDLAPGSLLDDSSLGELEVPADYLDARRIRASERENLLGVSVQQKLRAGEGLVWSDLADGAAHRHLASIVLPGRRAYSLDATANPLGRLLRVGDHVDLLLEAGGTSETLLERVLVLAVGGQIETEELSGSRAVTGGGVTLSVSAQEAEKLLQAESRGDLRLVLRNPEDLTKTAAKDPERERQKVVAGAASSSEGRQEIEHVR